MNSGTTTTDPGNMTPASGNGPLTQQVCGLGADGQLVTMNMSIPPISPNMTPDTGQYCMSGGTLDGQCGTMTLDPTRANHAVLHAWPVHAAAARQRQQYNTGFLQSHFPWRTPIIPDRPLPRDHDRFH